MPVINLPRPVAGLPCWVRVREHRADGFVEFDLSIGDPLLSAELILPEAAFETFCRDNRVQRLDDAAAAQMDRDTARWRDGDRS